MSRDSERKDVYTVIEKGDDKKGWWVRIGTAFVNRDGSLSVKLDALPVNGTMQIRDRRANDDDDEQRGNGSRAPSTARRETEQRPSSSTTRDKARERWTR